ncbi:prolyl-tRNA synthetase associated domain-containing protein [Ancylobacter lacus]|uniref:prolyl-tRNA synthetase associated domain-containing protein n=1 Tax=Ancylobacter lacus TaxID=2579970 RepID=UPI001BD1991E|nr:prolyl-tRNA synthetase associated domain-containing protein [Ancylobacter lacus]MBS7537706.1 prolyl-tRNA synthetase associated domain-containing protein [Ancylobacter lacus]
MTSTTAPAAAAVTTDSARAAAPHLFARLAELGIATVTVDHPPLFTVEDSQRLRGEIAGGHTKNLFLKDKKGRLFLVVVEEEARVDLKSLHVPLGAASRLSFGSAELLEEVLGVKPGAVTAFGPINDTAGRVTVVLDAELLEHAQINCHPLCNTSTTTIGRDDLVRFLRATGHEPVILAVPKRAPEGTEETA